MHEQSLFFSEMNPGIVVKSVNNITNTNLNLITCINVNNHIMLMTSNLTAQGYIYNCHQPLMLTINR